MSETALAPPTLRRIRLWLGFFCLALVASGLTALPLDMELALLVGWAQPLSAEWPGLVSWLKLVQEGVHETHAHYPFMAYGTDWLAFSHLVIAVAFVGALRDPVRNVWVVEFGMIACLMVPPFALVFGEVRGIPLLWRLVDASFGVGGMVPLWIARRLIGSCARPVDSPRSVPVGCRA